ncbi:MAG: hypothetical protein MUC65_00470 [Pontiellaceae bacterium]|jgi:hypothetical protein|nr:hypothetical protein [Pontiellaceae bacterium]
MRFTDTLFPIILRAMKTLKKAILLCVLLLASGCFRNNIRSETFHLEQLRNEESVNILRNALRQVDGVKELQPNLREHTLTVIFNGLNSQKKNVEYAIIKAGFDLPNWPADPADKAKLPEALR